jgi:ABC-type ATPase with predicted acetyltransferase domain
MTCTDCTHWKRVNDLPIGQCKKCDPREVIRGSTRNDRFLTLQTFNCHNHVSKK